MMDGDLRRWPIEMMDGELRGNDGVMDGAKHPDRSLKKCWSRMDLRLLPLGGGARAAAPPRPRRPGRR